MRLDPILDSWYVLGSLWGVLTGSSICASSPPVVSRVAHDAVWTPGSEALPAPVTAFVDVNVVPMDREQVLSHQTVLVEGGKITALGPVNSVKVPAGAVRIDGRGQYLIPGLTDMHAHFQFYFGEAALVHDMFRFLAHGVTTVRNLNTINFNGYGGSKSTPEWFLRLKSAEVLGPRLYYPVAPSTDVFGEGVDTLVESLKLSTVTAQVTAAIADYRAAGYDYLMVQPKWLSLPPERRVLYDSLMAIAGRLNFTVSSHTNGESFEEMLTFGAYGGSVDHLYAFRDSLGTDASDARIQSVVAATKRAGTWISVTLDCVEERKKPPGIDISRRLVKAMQEAGIGLLMGIDADGAKGWSPSLVNEELKELVRAGLTPYQALLTATRNPAQFFGILDSSGTVTVGKRADLVLLRANPLADIRHVREPSGVMIAGRWLDRTTLDQGLLAPLKDWGRMEVQGGIMPKGGPREISAAVGTAVRIIDSLVAAGPQSPNYERLAQQFTGALGTAREYMSPEQREAFDPTLRVWMREQARQGRPVAIPNVTPTP